MANLDIDTASLQYRELAAAQAASSDLDYAFELQMQEALSASMGTTQYDYHGTTNSASNAGGNSGGSEMGDVDEGGMTLLLRLQALEFEKFQQEVADHKQAEEERRRLSEEIYRKSHDAKFARSIQTMPEDEWEATGDYYEKPFEAERITKDDRRFKLYYKGLISAENVDGVGDRWDTLAGAGVAIYDPDDNLILKLRKQLGVDLSRAVAEYLALKEGLMAAFDLGIRNVTAYGDCVQVYNQVIGRWNVRQRKVVKFHQDVVDQIDKLDKLFMVIIPRCDNKVALTLAREAIDTQLNKTVEHIHQGERSKQENCSICLEDINVSQMHEILTCRHRFCFPCMSQHVEVKLTHGCVPSCPHEGCNIKLTVDGCKQFLSSKWVEVWTKRLEEAAIPDSDKVYCPYPNCSALMTLSGIDRSRQACSSSHPFPTAIGCTECKQCHKLFCIECRVPWHIGMSCQEYQRRAPQLHSVDAKFHLLAKNSRWKRCTKCKHMIELAEGCNHMTCRCGFEFCYVCGAEWKNKKATCNCVLWDENNIIREPLTDDEYDSEEEEEEEDYESDDYFEDHW